MKVHMIKTSGILFRALCGAAALLALASCANSTSGGSSGGGGGGGSSSIADNPDTRYYGISGTGTAGGTTTAAGGGTPAAGGGTTPAPAPTPAPTPTPTPTPTPGPGIAMKTGPAINAALKALGANSGSGKSFVASASAPPAGAATQLLSDVTASTPTQVLAWADGSTIKYYAQGYTDSNRKILLNADSSEMFRDCTGLTSLNVSGFDTSNVTNMSYMFYDCSRLTSLNVSSFDTSKVTDMMATFSSCHKLQVIDVSSWNTSLVTNMAYMFQVCEELLTIYASNNFVTTSVTDSEYMWTDSLKLKGGQGTVCTSDSNKIYARIDDRNNGNPGYFTAKP